MTTDLQHVCDEVYSETASLYASKFQEMDEAAFGYAILYAPPVVRPEMLFLGYQPGGSNRDSAGDLEPGKRPVLPPRCEYAHAEWRLARRMREVWDVPTLERCTGLNANFFRAQSAARWNRLPDGLRRELEAFSLQQAERLARSMAPKQLIVIGLTTFRRLNTTQETVLLSGERGWQLVVQGTIWGLPAVGVVHLSGARILGSDWAAIRSHFADQK